VGETHHQGDKKNRWVALCCTHRTDRVVMGFEKQRTNNQKNYFDTLIRLNPLP
jgi:hypothetical protein